MPTHLLDNLQKACSQTSLAQGQNQHLDSGYALSMTQPEVCAELSFVLGGEGAVAGLFQAMVTVGHLQHVLSWPHFICQV